jgi:hypothetical protein
MNREIVPEDDLPQLNVVPTADLPAGIVPPDDLPGAGPTEVGLFSKKGAAIIGETVRTSLPVTVMQDQLRTHENVKAAWEKDPVRAAKWGHSEERYNEALQRIPELQSSLAQAEAETALPGETTPLRWARSAVQSITQNLPGLLASVVSRGAGAPAALPALHGAQQVAEAEGYTGARAEGAEIPEANIVAGVKGAAEVGFELMPLGFLIDKVGKLPVFELVKGLLVRDMPTELATTAADNITDWAIVHPEMTVKDFTEKLTGDLIDTAVVTAVSVPITGGIAKGVVTAGQMGQKRSPDDNVFDLTSLAVPDVGRHISEQLPVEEGAERPDPSAPSYDLPTHRLEGAQLQAIEDRLATLNPEDIDDKRLAEATERFKVAEERRRAPALPGAEMAWSQIRTAPTTAVEDAGELGASQKQVANAPNYVNPNKADRLDRPFSFGPEGYVGLTPRQVMPKPGTYVLGEPSDDRPADYLGQLHSTVEQWRQQYIPNSTIVLSNEQLFSNSALGWHYTTGKGQHMIVPAVLRKPSKGLGQYNPNTIATAFYNATHEFGHALISDRFYEGMPDEMVGHIRDLSRQGLVMGLNPAAVPPEQAAIIAEYNTIKSRILSDQMTAQEFVDTWMGPAKIGRATFLKDLGVSAKAPAKQLINAIADRAVENSNISNEVGKASLKQHLIEDSLNLEEYLAEQTARHAYKARWDQSSPLGRFFSETLRIMRQFFVDRKKDGTIAPGIAFSEWMEGLGKVSRPMEEKRELAKRKTKIKRTLATVFQGASGAMSENLYKAAFDALKAGKATISGVKDPIIARNKSAYDTGQIKSWQDLKAREEPTKAKSKTKVKKVQHNVEADTDAKREASARKMVITLVRGKIIERGDSMYQDLMGYSSRHEFEEFLDTYTKLTGKAVKFEWIPPGVDDISNGDPNWNKQHFSSAEFKAWFGDWERDPQGSSKIRIGAFSQDRMGIISVDNEAMSPPLVLFTTAERLRQGENAFHASTPRGQFYAESRRPDQPEDMSLVPVVLNIRNPFIVGEFEAPAPQRQELEAQGHDGIVYQNDLDGDLSFITFRPDQIKVVPDRAPYGTKGEFHLELDVDQSTPAGRGISKLIRTVSNFVEDPRLFARSLKHSWRAARYGMQLQQLAQAYPEESELQFVFQTNSEVESYRRNRLVIPDKNIDFWEDTNNREHEQIANFLRGQNDAGVPWFELASTTKMRNGRPTLWWERKRTADTDVKLKQYGIDPETPRGEVITRHILNIENSLLDSLNEDEQILRKLLAHRYADDEGTYNDAVFVLARQIHEMRQVPFLPRKWFGKHIVVVTKKSTTGPGYEVVWKEAYDFAWQRDKAFERLSKRKAADMEVQRKPALTDTEYVLMGLPKDFLNVAAEELGLDPEQVDKLTEILQPVRQERMLKERDLKELGVGGFSEDVMRAYSAYTWHHANLQWKMLYRKQFNMAIDRLRRKVDALGYTNDPELYKKQHILRALEGVRDYILSPPNEWHAARAFVSIAYLAFGLKTALANGFGLALTWSDLSARHGSLKGEDYFHEAVKRSNALMVKGTVPPDVQWAFEKAQDNGIVDQTMAYHIAGVANQNRLWKVLSRRRAIRYFQKAVDAGMAPFRLMEMFTRRVTFLAAVQEGLDAKLTPQEAYDRAVKQTNALQNDYSAGNRVPVMRGKMAMITIFMSFAQHGPAWHGLGGYEAAQRKTRRFAGEKTPAHELLHGHTVRIWALLFYLAGYEGLPFAEMMIDVAEWIWKRFGKRPVRQELREILQSIHGAPHDWSRGLMHNVWGFDLARSIGFGRPFPGTEVLAKSQEHNVEENVGTLALDMAGVTGHMLKFGLELTGAMGNKTPTEAMRKAPGVAGALWNSYEWSKYGVLGPDGGRISWDPETKQPRDLTLKEIIGRAAGALPTAVSEPREMRFAQYDRVVFWTTTQNRLKRNVWRAEVQNDPEMGQEARAAIAEFNEKIADDPELRKLRISGGDLARYLQTQRKQQRREEQNRPTNKRFRGLYEDIRRSYDRPSEEDNSGG